MEILECCKSVSEVLVLENHGRPWKTTETPGKGKVVRVYEKIMSVLKNQGKPLKAWKRESCKCVSEDHVGIGEPRKTLEILGKGKL